MNYRIMFLIHALIAVLLGLGLLVVSSRTLGVDEYATPRLFSQFLGTVMLGLGLLLWFAKDATDVNLQKGIGIGLLISDAAGLMVTIMGTTSGILRADWWIPMAFYAILGLAYAFLVFLKPEQLNQR
jgi:hypothetical protein